MNVDNARRSRSHLTSYDDSIMTITYDPYRLWKFINSYHCSITEARLTVITSTLHSLKQKLSDSLSTHLDNFNIVLNEFYKFFGQMSKTQATRLLISSLRPEYDTTVKMIYMTVKELTIQKVSNILLESEVQSGGWANSAVFQLSSHAASTESISGNQFRRSKCTQAVCVGPHDRQECFKLSQNSEKKATWIAKQEAGCVARSQGRSVNKTGVCGVKTVKAPMAHSATIMLFYVSFDNVSLQESSVKASYVTSPDGDPGTWALLDTGACHHMFNDESMFLEFY